MIFSFHIPLKDIKKNFIRKIKTETKQIPENQSGIIIINSWLNFRSYIRYSRQLLKRNNFKNIRAIIIWHKDKHEIIPRENMTKEFLDFLRIPFK